MERNHRPTFEAENPQAGAQIVASIATIRKHREIAAAILDAVDIANRSFRTVAQGDVVVEIDQIAEGFRAEFDLMAYAAVSSVGLHAGREWWQTPALRGWPGQGQTEWHRKRQ